MFHAICIPKMQALTMAHLVLISSLMPTQNILSNTWNENQIRNKIHCSNESKTVQEQTSLLEHKTVCNNHEIILIALG